MRSLLRTLFFLAAATSASVALYLTFALPPPPIRLDGSVPRTQVLGGYHIHTNRSDGSGSIDDVAAAASRAGLAFVIVTDHGDATRTPDAPAYRHGVLVIDAVEVNTDGGHVVALGLSGPAPYPLAGNPRDVIEDIHRLGAKAIVAHPDSPKLELSWRGPNTGFDGIEWLNADSEWRNKPPRRVLGTAYQYLLRPAGAIASLFVRPARSLQRWDDAARGRPVFGLAALDAHARIGWREAEEPRTRTAFNAPSYESMFRTLAQAVLLDRPLSGDAREDSARVLAALIAGHSFSMVRAFAEPASLEFTASQAGVVSAMGGRLPSGATTFHAAVVQAPGARLLILRDGRPVSLAQGFVDYSGEADGVYRVEVSLPGKTVPWIVSNPIVVGGPAPGGPEPVAQTAPAVGIVSVPLDLDTWTTERDQSSSGTLKLVEAALQFDFHLGLGKPQGQYAALAANARSQDGIDRIMFTARASGPMRVSVQVRLPGGKDGQRWRRSVYVDAQPREMVVPLAEFEPADGPTSRRPNVAPVQSLLFVIDTLNTKPDTSGTVWLSSIRFGTRTADAVPDTAGPRGAGAPRTPPKGNGPRGNPRGNRVS